MATPDPNRVLIFDTTLRDGEQSPGCSMTQTEKLRVAKALAELGVDIIEAGFPIASRGDWEAVNAIAKEVHGPIDRGPRTLQSRGYSTSMEGAQGCERSRASTFFLRRVRSTASSSSTWRRMKSFAPRSRA